MKIESSNLYFAILLIVLSVICWFVAPYKDLAMWTIFFLAAYSAIANDSIQTIGTFIASNSHRKWYYLWLFMGSIFLLTVTYSWLNYDGDISHGRLFSKGLNEAPSNFVFLQVFAPVVLLIITRLKMPVSTSILLLSAFTTQASSITSIISKSFFGYFIAFCIAIFVWIITTGFFEKYKKTKPSKIWVPLQWVSSGALWSTWIMQDMANIAVVLPRSLNLDQFVLVASSVFFGLGLLFYLKGDRIQEIVTEKSDIIDVRAATVVDFIYACLLYYLKIISTIPISTTWVFIGLLGGREIAINFRKIDGDKVRAIKLLVKDTVYAFIGLLVSVILAISINENMRNQIFKDFGIIDEKEIVEPLIKTEKVERDIDDPAIWYNEKNPSKSIILGTQKDENGALIVYDLKGEIDINKSVYGLARPNNVDVLNDVLIDGNYVDIAVVTERLKNNIRIYSLPEMIELDGGGLRVFENEINPQPMGIALWRDDTGYGHVIVGKKNGVSGKYLNQYKLESKGDGTFKLKFLRSFGSFSGIKEIEAIAIDLKNNYIYYSDENFGVRKYHADVENGNDEIISFGNNFVGDHEGISIIFKKNKYIVVSDQQPINQFRIFMPEKEYKEIGSFFTTSIDSDGSDFHPGPFPAPFKNGIFVAMSDDLSFHYFSWDQIKTSFEVD